jgi:tellurite resistance-related uncharacterized protein
MSMNPILNHAIFQLAEVGIRKPKVWKGGKHYRISWEHHGEYRTLTVPLSPGDHRSQKNNAAQLKRILRADGLLKKEPIKEMGSTLDKPVTINANGVPFVPPELVERIEALEKDMVAMLDLILEARDKPAPAPVNKFIRSQLWEQKQARRRLKRLA